MRKGLAVSAVLLSAAAWLLMPSSPHAQEGFRDFFKGAGAAAEGGGADGEAAKPVTVKSWFTPAEGDEPARLYIQADLGKGWHIYSITQRPGGPGTTKLRLDKSDDYKLIGRFKAIPPPKKHFDKIAFKMDIEEHYTQVVWHAPIEIAPDVDPAKLKISGGVYAQACNAATCLRPENFKFTAAKGDKRPAKKGVVGVYRHRRAVNATIRGYVEPGAAAPGQTVKLVLSAEPSLGYHVYQLSNTPNVDAGSKPTMIAVTHSPFGWKIGEPAAGGEPVQGDGTPYYEGPVTFTMDVTIPEDAKPGTYWIDGGIGYQACAKTCDQPRSAFFEAKIEVAASASTEQTPLVFFEGKYGEVEQLFVKHDPQPPAAAPGGPSQPAAAPPKTTGEITGELPWEPYDAEQLGKLNGFDPEKLEISQEDRSDDNSLSALLLVLGGGFLGGMFLNVMPCVLPVIGLKIMSFVQQAGESRGRVLLLNVTYSLGLMSVFLVLATAAIGLGLSWGQQFSNVTFTIVMISIVFAFALSMLGVWEIPIPGFVGRGAATDLAEREGLGGAFAKGVLTTILATPCTGPFLGAALTWAVRQPPSIVYATFASVGLGMAFPYLLIGAFPKLVSVLLPKPGAWMETFKHLMGFMLLGTVVWFLMTVPPAVVVPTIALLFGIWLACWWAGRIPITAAAQEKWRGWATAGVVAGLAVMVSFGWLDDVMKKRFDFRYTVKAGGQRERPPGKYTVLVDFTADWCLNCKTMAKLALDTVGTHKVVEENEIVTLKADLTEENAPGWKLLNTMGFDGGGIPVVAIFPADSPNRPIILQGIVSQSTLLDALKQAGPSQPEQRTAMRGN